MKRKILLVLLCILMIVPVSRSAADGILDFIRFTGNGDPVSWQIHMEVLRLPQFSKDRTEKLNRLLKHVDFSGTSNEKETRASVLLDGEELYSIRTYHYRNRSETVLLTDSMHCYTFNGTGTEGGDLLPVSVTAAEKAEKTERIMKGLDAMAVLLEQLPEAFPDHVSRTKVSSLYKGFGTASAKVILKLTDGELNAFFDERREEFVQACQDPYFERILFTGRQGFTFYLTDSGRLLRVSYSGKACWEEGDIRDIRLEWKTARNEDSAKDDLQLKTPNEKRTGRNNLVLKYSWTRSEDGTEKLSWDGETDRVKKNGRIQEKETAEILMMGNVLEGSLADTITENSHKTISKATVTACCESADNWNGILEIISKKDKIETEHTKTAFKLSAGISVPVASIEPEPVTLSGEEYSRLTETLYAGIIRKLLKLPEEDLAFLKEGIPDVLWNTAVTNP